MERRDASALPGRAAAAASQLGVDPSKEPPAALLRGFPRTAPHPPGGPLLSLRVLPGQDAALLHGCPAVQLPARLRPLRRAGCPAARVLQPASARPALPAAVAQPAARGHPVVEHPAGQRPGRLRPPLPRGGGAASEPGAGALGLRSVPDADRRPAADQVSPGGHGQEVPPLPLPQLPVGRGQRP